MKERESERVPVPEQSNSSESDSGSPAAKKRKLLNKKMLSEAAASTQPSTEPCRCEELKKELENCRKENAVLIDKNLVLQDGKFEF